MNESMSTGNDDIQEDYEYRIVNETPLLPKDSHDLYLRLDHFTEMEWLLIAMCTWWN